MKIHIIMHESFEAPGAIELWGKNKRHEITYTRLYMGDSFPNNSKDFDFLVVMGGPQSPATTVEECAHFDAEKELRFIKTAIDDNKTLLGVCLGAQLIGEALGAKFDHSPNREIGVFEVTLTEKGKKNPFFATLPEKFNVGHWHGDMPGLTPETQILAYSDGCPRQIVRYAPKIYGFQCHFEFTPETMEQMIANSISELSAYKNLPFVESGDKLRTYNFREINERLFEFLDYLVTIA